MATHYNTVGTIPEKHIVTKKRGKFESIVGVMLKQENAKWAMSVQFALCPRRMSGGNVYKTYKGELMLVCLCCSLEADLSMPLLYLKPKVRIHACTCMTPTHHAYVRGAT